MEINGLIWQDVVFLFCAFVLNAMCLPTLFDSKAKVNAWTSITFVGTTFIQGIVLITLGMYLSAIMYWIGTIIWGLILIYRRT